jgi:hypothetical protein
MTGCVYLDYLYELPTDTQLQFEQGDPKLVKEKLWQKAHYYGACFPLSMIRTASRQECIDKTKEFLDIIDAERKVYFLYLTSLR